MVLLGKCRGWQTLEGVVCVLSLFLHSDVREWLFLAGARDGCEPNRRRALWSDLPDFTLEERFRRESDALEFSPQGNPIPFRRKWLTDRKIVPCATLAECEDGETITVAGLLLRPHRPPTPSGAVVVFFALEDETALVQVTMFSNVYQQYGEQLFGHAAIAVRGWVQRPARESVWSRIGLWH